MQVEKIENLKQVLNLEEKCEILDYKIERLTAAGENYGSLMLKLDITIQNGDETEELNTVAKLTPPNEFIQKVFNTQTTFKNEIAFYKKIIPTLQDFQKEQQMTEIIDFYPKFYGGRINLTGDDDKVDNDAVLILENLKSSGYVNLDRTKGFDYETSKLILTDLAYLHAIPLALKIHKPEVFENEIKKYLANLPIEDPDQFNQKLMDVIDGIEEVTIYKNRVKQALENFNPEASIREPFATLIHNDCWVNNTMLKMERNKPIKNKLVDFQICSYGSPAKDVLFFLFSSVQNHILNKHLDFFIKFYHKIFQQNLEKLRCDSTRFSLQAFHKEIEVAAKNTEFVHSLFMTFPIFAPKGSVKEISDLQPDDFIDSEPPSELLKEKIIFIVKEFARRHWI